jgi:23S rRNA pseudouridine1911/1915/1917 synthase
MSHPIPDAVDEFDDAPEAVRQGVRVELSPLASSAGVRLDKWLPEAVEAQALTLSRSRARALIEAGALTLDGTPATDPRAEVRAGGRYALLIPPAEPAVPEPEAIALRILHEDAHLIVVDKAAGMAVHPAPGSWTGTLVNALLHHCGAELSGIGGVARPGIVHRLDKDTSGVMVAAKTALAHAGLVTLFQAHDLERAYLALVRGVPRPRADTIDAPIARSSADRKKMAVAQSPDSPGARRAVTHYRVLETFGQREKGATEAAASLVRCTLETGRTHQIRVHMAHAGHALIGDPVYARNPGLSAHGTSAGVEAARHAARHFPRQALHAARLAFVHPVSGERMTFETDPPEDFTRLLALLRAM